MIIYRHILLDNCYLNNYTMYSKYILYIQISFCFVYYSKYRQIFMQIQPNTIIQALTWRYAVQAFDTAKTIDKEKLHAILESARLAPSAIGIEPWKFIVVENPEIRKKLREVGYGQPKITDSPYLIVIAYRTDLKENSTRERLER